MARILVIDDEAPIRQNLVRLLALEGHQGATGYVTKPFNLANLRQLLATQLAHLPHKGPTA